MSQLNTLANSEFGMDYEQLGSSEKEWCVDEIENEEYKRERKQAFSGGNFLGQAIKLN